MERLAERDAARYGTCSGCLGARTAADFEASLTHCRRCIAAADAQHARARLAALTEVHEFYEFDATTEEQFDAWLHERIKEVRDQVRGHLGIGATDSLAGAPVPASDRSRSSPAAVPADAQPHRGRPAQ